MTSHIWIFNHESSIRSEVAEMESRNSVRIGEREFTTQSYFRLVIYFDSAAESRNRTARYQNLFPVVRLQCGIFVVAGDVRLLMVNNQACHAEFGYTLSCSNMRNEM